MKARIIPTVPETVLYYKMGEKAGKLEAAARSLGMTCKAVPRNNAGETVGFLAGYAGFSSSGSSEEAESGCVIFSGISGKRLDALLKAMREAELDIPLKAVVTAYNQKMTVKELLAELEKEHKALSDAGK